MSNNSLLIPPNTNRAIPRSFPCDNKLESNIDNPIAIKIQPPTNKSAAAIVVFGGGYLGNNGTLSLGTKSISSIEVDISKFFILFDPLRLSVIL